MTVTRLKRNVAELFLCKGHSFDWCIKRGRVTIRVRVTNRNGNLHVSGKLNGVERLLSFESDMDFSTVEDTMVFMQRILNASSALLGITFKLRDSVEDRLYVGDTSSWIASDWLKWLDAEAFSEGASYSRFTEFIHDNYYESYEKLCSMLGSDNGKLDPRAVPSAVWLFVNNMDDGLEAIRKFCIKVMESFAKLEILG